MIGPLSHEELLLVRKVYTIIIIYFLFLIIFFDH